MLRWCKNIFCWNIDFYINLKDLNLLKFFIINLTIGRFKILPCVWLYQHGRKMINGNVTADKMLSTLARHFCTPSSDFILVPTSFRTTVANFSHNLFINFYLKFCTLIEFKKQKNGRSWYCRKILNNLKWKNIQFWKFCPISYKTKCSHPIRLHESLIIIISGRKAMICLIFSAWWYSSRRGSIWDYCLWLSVSRYAHPNILRLIMSAFGWSVGIGTLKIVQNERSINSLGKKQFNTQNLKLSIKIYFCPIRLQNRDYQYLW